MKEILDESKRIINKYYSDDDEFYGLYVLSCYGLLTKFDNYKEIIEDTFKTCEFKITNQKISELLSNLGENIPDDYIETDTDYLEGLSDVGIGYYMKDDKPIPYKDHNPIVYLTTKYGFTLLLDTTIHELSHLIKGRINIVYKNNNDIIQRSGLRLITTTKDNMEIWNNHLLDEIINVFQVYDMISSIKDIDSSMLDISTKKFYEKLEFNTLDEPNGYEVGVMLLKPLWDNNHFKNLIEANIVEGNIETIENGFNEIIGNNNSFNIFSLSLDIIFDTENYNESEILERGIYIDNIVNLYNLKTKNFKVKKKD